MTGNLVAGALIAITALMTTGCTIRTCNGEFVVDHDSQRELFLECLERLPGDMSEREIAACARVAENMTTICRKAAT